ncbi:MAG TPA: CaiB/BaiF CoA-transferase family protein [Mycobacteriales bacterium]|nr:CaiB/BaiF CoA-transferase family protein [Mycobacteriales bacterium]
MSGAGPLAGLRVVELAGLGPVPFCAMVLADLGAEVLRVERTGMPVLPPGEVDRRMVLTRGRPAIGVDLKHPQGTEVVLRLVEKSDVLLEGFRPGVLERLGLGPDVLLARNPRLVVGRVTGYGQDGPMAHDAGHDINYLSLSGVLGAIGPSDAPPVPPLSILGDFGGGAFPLALGVLAALLERERSGQGQVVDAAIVDGTALLATIAYEMRALGQWGDRGTNLLDGGAPHYGVYETADGLFLSVGALEEPFHRAFLSGLGFADAEIPSRDDASQWAATKDRVAAVLRTKDRDEWLEVFRDAQACVTPVLTLADAPAHPHNVARGTFTEVAGLVSPSPAPRFSRSTLDPPSPPPRPGEHDLAGLTSWGLTAAEIDALVEADVLG